MPSFLAVRVLLGTARPNSSRTDAHYTCTTPCAQRVHPKKLTFGEKVPLPVFRSTVLLMLYGTIPQECALPPTFQSWFTVTNLHVWLLTVRLRALPAPHGLNHIQGLIDHFFQDVEVRVRTVLQPGALPPRLTSDASPTFYTFPSPVPPPDTFVSPAAYAKAEKKARAPERLITRHMKILKEQWAGLGMSMDLGLVRGDAEMAAAIWRNLLGGRGARGISVAGVGATASSIEVENTSTPGFRRSVNLVGGLVDNVEKIDVDVEETRDDLSGVYDFGANESDR